MSPSDIVKVYRYLHNDMPSDASAFIRDALASAPPRSASGFYQDFGIPDALRDTEHVSKQGWMRIESGVVLNTTGLVGSDQRYAVTLLTEQPADTRFTIGRKAVTAGVEALVARARAQLDAISDPEAGMRTS